MPLNNKEKIISIISNGIAVFSLLQERDELPKNTTMYDFVLKVIPEDIKSELSVELIDEVFIMSHLHMGHQALKMANSIE